MGRRYRPRAAGVGRAHRPAVLLGIVARRHERRGGLLLIAGLACSSLTAFAWILALARFG